MTIEEFKTYHPANNFVALKPAIKTDKVSEHLFAPLSLADGKPYDEFKSQPIVCSVVTVPRKLIFGTRKVYRETIEELDLTPQQKAYLYQARKATQYSETTLIDVPIPGSMPCKTPVQLKENDIVWVNSNALINAERTNKIIDVAGQMIYLIPYGEIYLKKSGDDVCMLNGWLLAELIEDSPEWTKRAEKMGLVIPQHMKREQFNDKLAVVKYIGDPVEYLFNDRYDFPDVKAGDVIYLRWKVNRKLEPGQKFFAKDADLIVSRRCNILAIME